MDKLYCVVTKHSSRHVITGVFWILSLSFLTIGSIALSAEGVFLLPNNCAELLPDNSQFVGFLEAVAKGQVTTDRSFSKRILRILSLREKMNDAASKYRDTNPVDLLIRRTECFYREQKEPIQPVAFNNPTFISFLKSGLKELETKVDDAIFDWEIERQQRNHYELQLKKNQSLVESLRKEADHDARVAFEQLSNKARRKVQAP